MATFITTIGPEALEVYNGLPFEDDGARQNMDTILTLMERHCLGETNIIYERYLFNNRDQKDTENIDTYATHLRALARSCNFRDLKDELIHDRIVCGIRDDAIRKELLQEPQLTLARCIGVCRAVDSTSAQVRAMSSRDTEVHYLKGSRDSHVKMARGRRKDHSQGRSKSTGPKGSTPRPPGSYLKYDCKY